MNPLMNLITTYNFRGKEYLIILNSPKHQPVNIEIKVSDKRTSEEWMGTYDASYIENLTQKTGNFKRFETFISMLKSGLLKSSQCVTLDLLTFEDLEILRNRTSHARGFTASHASQMFPPQSSNRRYLIVTYTVEFDRIHYPLALEYCGPPDPRVLQETIQRLEKQVVDLQHQLSANNWDDISIHIDSLQNKVVEVTSENVLLKEQIKKITLMSKSRNSRKEIDMLLKSIHCLENKLESEKINVENLERENAQLKFQLEESQKSEKFLRAQLNIANLEPSSINKKNNISRKFSPFLLHKNKSLENCAEKPFPRPRMGERKICSARSSYDVNLIRSSSEESFGGNVRERSKLGLDYKLSPRVRASSPSPSDLSHNSGHSRCACKSCLHSKYLKPGDFTMIKKKQDKAHGKIKLLKRIQSLEKLVSGIVIK